MLFRQAQVALFVHERICHLKGDRNVFDYVARHVPEIPRLGDVVVGSGDDIDRSGGQAGVHFGHRHLDGHSAQRFDDWRRHGRKRNQLGALQSFQGRHVLVTDKQAAGDGPDGEDLHALVFVGKMLIEHVPYCAGGLVRGDSLPGKDAQHGLGEHRRRIGVDAERDVRDTFDDSLVLLHRACTQLTGGV